MTIKDDVSVVGSVLECNNDKSSSLYDQSVNYIVYSRDIYMNIYE